MQVLTYIGPGHVEIGERPRPTIGTGEVLVRVRACGICATDVKTYLRGHAHIPPGSVLGHEMSGVIAESQAAGWDPGERVVVAPYVPCGDCSNCARGEFTLCRHLHEASAEPGGYSEFVRVPPRLVKKGLLRVPETLDLTVASLVEPVACCLFGLDALDLKPRESLLIVGDGAMGLMQAILARALGASPVVLAGMTPARLEVASRYADRVVNVADADLRQEIMALPGGEGMDKVIVSVGQGEVAENALSLVRRGGRINLFAGLPSQTRLAIDPGRIHYDRVTLVGTSGFAPSHFREALGILDRNADSFRALITRTMPLNEVERALRDNARYEGIKMVALLG